MTVKSHSQKPGLPADFGVPVHCSNWVTSRELYLRHSNLHCRIPDQVVPEGEGGRGRGEVERK